MNQYPYRDKSAMILCGIVVFFTVLSQLPLFVDKGLSSVLSMGLWGAFGIYTLFSVKKIYFKRLYYAFILFLVYYLLILIFSFFNSSYIKSNLFNPICIAFIVMIVGTICGQIINIVNLKIFYLLFYCEFKNATL